jgi:hypothetical protein
MDFILPFETKISQDIQNASNAIDEIKKIAIICMISSFVNLFLVVLFLIYKMIRKCRCNKKKPSNNIEMTIQTKKTENTIIYEKDDLIEITNRNTDM